MKLLVALSALLFLLLAAYHDYSVLWFAPIAAMVAVFYTSLAQVPPMFTGLLMDRMVVLVENYLTQRPLPPGSAVVAYPM